MLIPLHARQQVEERPIFGPKEAHEPGYEVCSGGRALKILERVQCYFGADQAA